MQACDQYGRILLISGVISKKSPRTQRRLWCGAASELRGAASGAEQPFARWPLLGAWPRGLNDRSEKEVCISLIGSIAAKIRPSLAYEGGNSFLRVIGSAGRDDGIFFCGELVGQTGFE